MSNNKAVFGCRKVFQTLMLLVSAGIVCAQQGTPIELEGLDISAFDAKVAASAAKANTPGASVSDKADAAAAYLARANLFRDAGNPRWYKLAVGDYRRVLRFQPENKEAREKLDEIISIYESLRRPAPENGNEGDIYNNPETRFVVRPKQIELSRGGSSLVQGAGLTPGTAYVYQVSVKAGQRLSVSLNKGGDMTKLEVYQNRMDEAHKLTSEGTEWSGSLPSPGNLIIRVVQNSDPARYELELRLH